MSAAAHRRRLTGVWLLLLALTATGAWLGSGPSTRAGHHVGALLVALAFVKIRFVLLDFMEVRGAPWAMRVACEAWVVILAIVLILLDAG